MYNTEPMLSLLLLMLMLLLSRPQRKKQWRIPVRFLLPNTQISHLLLVDNMRFWSRVCCKILRTPHTSAKNWRCRDVTHTIINFHNSSNTHTILKICTSHSRIINNIHNGLLCICATLAWCFGDKILQKCVNWYWLQIYLDAFIVLCIYSCFTFITQL